MTRPYLNILNWAYLSTVYGKMSAQPGHMAATFPNARQRHKLLGLPGPQQWPCS